ncbi:MAG: HAD family hydrolase [Bacteroidales bacterium]
MRKAIFLDRDGVINQERGDYTYRIDQFHFNPGVFEALKRAQDKGYMLIVITNQGGIAKKRYTHEDVDRVHDYMLKEFKKHGIAVQEVYYCPHHSDSENCLCRKPKPLLIEKALARFQVNPVASFFVGDRDRDVEAAERARIKGIKINSNDNLNDYFSQIIPGY